MNWDSLKTPFLEADSSTQVDRLTFNLMRIQLLAVSGMDEPVAKHLLRESQFFIEWLVPQFDLETHLSTAAELVNLQRSLSQWWLNWETLWADTQSRQAMAALVQQWREYLQYQGASAPGSSESGF